MSDLLKLDNIVKKNGDIKAFCISSNLISTRTGKQGWGEATIAIDNVSVANILTDKVVGILYIVDKEEWEKEKLL